jgi:hypothetical protein
MFVKARSALAEPRRTPNADDPTCASCAVAGESWVQGGALHAVRA